MVGRWGMSGAIGPVAVLPTNGHGPLLPTIDEASEHTHRVVDAEVRRIVEAAYHEVSGLLREHRDQLDALADRLIEHETLDEADAYAAARIDHPNDESVARSLEERNRP
jgi:cell division protease FtsH